MCLTVVFNLLASSHLCLAEVLIAFRWIILVEFMFLFLRLFFVWHIGLFHYLIICVNDMFYTIINLLNQFEFIDFLYFEASLIDNIHISLAKIVILFLVFIMILASYKLNRLVSNKWSISKESMYALIRKGLLIHGLTLFSVLIPVGCPFALLPILVGFRYYYLYLSLQVVKLKTKSNPNFSQPPPALGGGLSKINKIPPPRAGGGFC